MINKSSLRTRLIPDGRKLTASYWLLRMLLIMLVIVTFIPFLLMVHMSLKTSTDIGINYWALPKTPEIANYTKAFALLVRPIVNSLFVAVVTLLGEIVLVALTGYTFGTYKFKGKDFFFFLFIAVMMIPYILQLVPAFFIITRIGLFDTYGALIIPYIAGLQVFGIIISRAFFASIPKTLYEAAKMEGAGDIYLFVKIALPLSVPILITVGIQSLISIYNDYVWPTLVLSGETKKMFSQAVVQLSSGYAIDYGITSAGYVIGAIPLVLITSFFMKYYLQGMMQGALKG